MKEETIREHQAIYAHAFLQQDLRNKNKNRVRALHEMVDPDYRKLCRNRRQKMRHSFGSVDTLVYFDILDVICEELKGNAAIRKSIIDLYASSYPNSEKIISHVRTLNRADAFDYLTQHQDRVLMSYVIFVMGEMEEFSNHSIWMVTFDKTEKNKDMYFEVRKFFSQVKFTGTTDSILESSAYKTYLESNRRAIADYMQCRESKLSAEINNLISLGFEEEQKSKNNKTVEMTARIERKLLMAFHQGAAYSFLGMQLKNPSWFKSYYYKPDVDHIIDDFYAAKAITEYYKNPYGFRENYLTETLVTSTPERDLEEILMLCNTDIIYKMYDVLMDLYYESFSWDKKFDDTSRSMIAARIKALEKEIDLTHSQNSKLRSEIMSLQSANTDNNNDAFRAYEEEDKKLRSKIEELEKQIQQQKDLIDAQTDLIDYLQKTEEESDEEIDVSRLQAYRYLFVGDFDTYLTEIKTIFPNSAFMTTETKDISGIQVDYIVFATKYISHSMYYKVKSSQLYTEYPSIMCNATSIKGVLSDLDQYVIDKKE